MISGQQPRRSDRRDSRGHNNGFTIVEVLIFLAVSALILVSALLLVGGSQRKNEFNQGVRDLQQQIDDIIDNVGTGYTAAGSDITCSVSGGGPPQLSNAANKLGQNGPCIFIGKIIQLHTDSSNFEVYSVVGRRLSSSNSPVSTMTEAQPRVFNEIRDNKTIRNGLIPAKIKAGGTDLSALGFFSTLNDSAATGEQTSGTQQIDLVRLGNSGSTGSTPPTSWFNNWASFASGYASHRNPTSGITICFNGPDANKSATIKIGGSNNQTGTTLNFGNSNCS